MTQEWQNQLERRLDQFLQRNGAPREEPTQKENVIVSMSYADYQSLVSDHERDKLRAETVHKYLRRVICIACAEAVALMVIWVVRMVG